MQPPFEEIVEGNLLSQEGIRKYWEVLWWKLAHLQQVQRVLWKQQIEIHEHSNNLWWWRCSEPVENGKNIQCEE